MIIVIIILTQKKKEPNLSLPDLSLTRTPPFPWLLSVFWAFAMKEMEHSLAFIDDLLDFNSDIGEGVDEEDEDGTGKRPLIKHNPNGSPDLIESNLLNSEAPCSAPVGVEEELEWISNKDAFPSVYTFVDNFSEQSADIAELSTPVSVLENTSTSSNNNNINKKNKSFSNVTFMSYSDNFKVPSKARSKILQKRRPEISSKMLWINQTTKNVVTAEKDNGIGRKCQHCGAEKTPQWRAGPLGPKTLCNACGVRFKSGRLVSEYRPANSPNFSHELHSNSHRKVMEMRRKKEKASLMNSVDEV